MLQHFYKYHGTGNDFIILDGWKTETALTVIQRQLLCDRHYGIGADGIMILTPSVVADFKMIYYNADGNLGSMCGNGGRCLAAFAVRRGYAPADCRFEASDGLHSAHVNIQSGIVALGMGDVNQVRKRNDGSCELNTGSPHLIAWQNPDSTDVFEAGKAIRYSEEFRNDGINVNFVEVRENEIYIRTYERGVEDETLSCGTGITAAVIAASFSGKINSDQSTVKVHAAGGELSVSFKRDGDHYTDIILQGPATKVFEGIISL